MTNRTPPPLTPTSIGVAEYADHDVRYGLIHRPLSDGISLNTVQRYPYKIACAPPLKAAKVVQRHEAPTNDWCTDCWTIGPPCTVTYEPGPMSPHHATARRGRFICNICGPLDRTHVDYGVAKDTRDAHLRAGGAG